MRLAARTSWPPMQISAATTKIRVLPRPGEPLFSYVYRLAALHGHGTLSAFLSQTAGGHFAEADIFNGQALAAISRLVDLPEEDLGLSTFVQQRDGAWKHSAGILPQETLSFKKLRACPCCLAGQDSYPDKFPHIDLLWTIAFVRACPVHHIELVELGWSRNDISGCHGKLLKLRQAAPRSLAAKAEIDFARFAASRLHLTDPEPEVESLADLSLEQALFAIKSLGNLLAHEVAPDRDQDQAEPEIASLYTAGFHAVCEYDSQLDQLFDRLRNRLPPRERLYRPADVFGQRLWRWARSLNVGLKLGEALRAYTFAHLRCDGDIIDSPRQVFDLSEVANEFDIPPSPLKRLRELSRMNAGLSTQGPLSKEEAHFLVIASKTHLSQENFAGYLNLTTGQLSILRDLAMIHPLADASQPARPFYCWEMMIESWEEFTGSSPRLKTPGRNHIILTKVHLIGRSFETCCRAIQAGTLTIAGHLGDYLFDHILLDTDDVLAKTSSESDRDSEPDLEDGSGAFLCNCAELRTRLRLGAPAAQYLDDRNILPSEQRFRFGRRREAPLFPRQDVETFDEIWIGPDEIERRYPDEIILRLSIDACRQPNPYKIQDFPFLSRTLTERYLEDIILKNRQACEELVPPLRPLFTEDRADPLAILRRDFARQAFTIASDGQMSFLDNL